MKKQSTRRKIHASLLIFITLALMVAEFWGAFLYPLPKEADKALHFWLGREIAGGFFLVFYTFLILRVMVIRKVSSQSLILWIPPIIAASFLAGILVVVALSLGKEFFDYLGFGTVDAQDLWAGVEGALSMAPIISIIIVITPFLMPLDLTLQIPRLLVGKKGKEGKEGPVDNYQEVKERHVQREDKPRAILAEDDIDSALPVLELLDILDIKCLHVESGPALLRLFKKHIENIDLVICDNFLRVDRSDLRMTGSDLVLKLGKKYPRDKRDFRLLVITGHTHLLDPEVENIADGVMQKPADLTAISLQLKKWGLTEKA